MPAVDGSTCVLACNSSLEKPDETVMLVGNSVGAGLVELLRSGQRTPNLLLRLARLAFGLGPLAVTFKREA